MIEEIKNIQEKIDKYKKFIKDNNIDGISEISFYPISKNDDLFEKLQKYKLELYYYQNKFIERKLKLI